MSGRSRAAATGEQLKAVVQALRDLLDRKRPDPRRSQFDREFHTWSRMLLHLAWISLATHVMIYLNRVLDPAHPLIDLIAIRAFEIAAMGAVLGGLSGYWTVYKAVTNDWIGQQQVTGRLGPGTYKLEGFSMKSGNWESFQGAFYFAQWTVHEPQAPHIAVQPSDRATACGGSVVLSAGTALS